MTEQNILIGSLEALKNHSRVFHFLFEEKSLALFHSEGHLFPHMGSVTWTKRERYKEKSKKRRLKSRSERAQGRDYGDLKPPLPPHLFPAVFQRQTGT